MKILALETSGKSGSIALLTRNDLIRQVDLPSSQRTAQSLAPAIAHELDRLGWPATDLDLIAVTQGPGSFTGLRVGATTAKTLAYAVKAHVLGVNTLDVVARQTPTSVEKFVVVMDAMRGQFFRKLYQRGADDAVQATSRTAIVEPDALAGELSDQWAITGPAAEQLASDHGFDLPLVETSCRFPRAADVGRLAWHEHNAGRREDLWALAPEYYRKSAAEEKLEETG